MPKNQRQSDWRDGFLFLGNHLALDFLNTRPVMDGKPVELIPDFHALLRWFQAAELISRRERAQFDHEWGNTSVARNAVNSLVGLRERLRPAVVNWEVGKNIQPALFKELDGLMAQYPMLSRFSAPAGHPELESWFRADRPEALAGPIAYYAASLFAEHDRTRVRQCGACVLHFLDTSKKGTRHWCSMKLCGNRKKVAAYASRQRKTVE
jgi:predicted RNA-binding Zn ribbon-like protein